MLDELGQMFGEIFRNGSQSGGIVGLAAGAALLAGALFKFASEQFRGIMKKLFADSWQSVVALTVASGGFLLLTDRYYSPAILALVAVVACLWASHGKRKLAEGARIGGFSMSGFPVASLVLLILVPVYVTAHFIEKRVAADHEQKLLDQEDAMTVTFVLPSHNRSEDLDDQSALEAEKEFFKQIYQMLHESPLMSHDTVDVRPMSVPAEDFEGLKQEYPPGSGERGRLARKLITQYRKQSPVDLVLASALTKIENQDQTMTYNFLVFDLDWVDEQLIEQREFRKRYVGGNNELERRRVALLAATDFTQIVLTEYPKLWPEIDFRPSDQLLEDVWEYLNKQFRIHYADHIEYHSHSDPAWKGHDLDASTSTEPARKEDVLGWYEAFSASPPDPGAEGNFNASIRASEQRLGELTNSTSAHEGSGPQ